jgi:hypothetical protein
MIITSSKCRPQNNEERFWLTVSPYQIRLSAFCNRSLLRDQFRGLLLPHAEVVITDVHHSLMLSDSLQREFILARG